MRPDIRPDRHGAVPLPARPPLEPVEITAGALHLRPWRTTDAGAMFSACQDPEIQRWTQVPAPYTREHAEDFVGRQARAAWAAATSTPLAVVDATTEALLASVSLQSMTDEGDAEIAFWCVPEARGQGVTTRAAAALLRWGFGALGLERVEWRAAVGNHGSLRVAQKLGFSLDGTLRHAIVLGDGARHDCWVGSRLATDPPA
ncbi:Protein N-acetyltransferase, RimJ/RimL family [Parafrankia irregularis]|uniref:Protein N-acetyltransferase, RimJ/RimL family n=1 Tax=Parafrankia irregularis TaxID=795642 RepID=A0A0S4QWM7_9ACTN|nr:MULTISPECIES: GNAT family N-acetyltransferase [Parafrankia]MBE3202846.1 GNAT family N-acetyltransferase [Parafrankia sp. CH37]CUU59989.1 Protein N-acetyltransferase, RimJ/RimL family [Parafrankia irregularis]